MNLTPLDMRWVRTRVRAWWRPSIGRENTPGHTRTCCWTSLVLLMDPNAGACKRTSRSSSLRLNSSQLSAGTLTSPNNITHFTAPARAATLRACTIAGSRELSDFESWGNKTAMFCSDVNWTWQGAHQLDLARGPDLTEEL